MIPLPEGDVLVTFVVPGKAVPWRPARVTRGGQHSYKPGHVAAWQKTVRGYAALAMVGKAKAAGPVRLLIQVARKASRKKDVGGWSVTRPDLDNLAKAISDSCNGIVYDDDNQVANLEAEKFLAERDEVRVTVFRLSAQGDPR